MTIESTRATEAQPETEEILPQRWSKEAEMLESWAQPVPANTGRAIQQVRPKQQFPDIPAPTAWEDVTDELLAFARANPSWYEFRTVYAAPVAVPALDVEAELLAAADAVIARWDSPKWKDEAPTADYIARLRAAVNEASANSNSGAAQGDALDAARWRAWRA